MHDSEAHDDKQVLGEKIRFVVAVIVGEVKHPLQEVIGFFVRGIRQLCLPAAEDHWDEKLFLGVLHLLLESPDAWEKLGDEGTDEVGEWPQEDYRDADVDGVVCDDVDPVLVAGDLFPCNDARGRAREELEKHVVRLDCDPVACVYVSLARGLGLGVLPSHLGTSVSKRWFNSSMSRGTMLSMHGLDLFCTPGIECAGLTQHRYQPLCNSERRQSALNQNIGVLAKNILIILA